MKKLLAVLLAAVMVFAMTSIAMAEEVPEGYTQVKVFDGTYGFGDAEITAYTNDDFSAFYLAWEAFDEDQVLEGTVEDGIVNVAYDETGFMTGDAQLIWDDAVASEEPWEAAGTSAPEAEDTSAPEAEDTSAQEAADASAPEETAAGDLKDYQNYLWDLSGDLSDEEFATLAVRNYKFIQSVEPLIDADSFKALYKANVHLKQKAEGSREEFIEAQNNLVMNSSIADGVIFLWDKDNIPSAPEDAELTDEELDAAPLDGVGFVPLMVKCLLDDPAQAKGNIIVISGGAGSNRSNSGEAYPAIPVFQDLGYNVFVLQYRIAPYDRKDMGLDTQRAVRLVKYYAQQEGWGGQDMIAAAGWSAGAGCITNAINNFYGDINGTKVDESYVPDEIDLTINGDMDVAMPIYGGGINEDCENPNIPALYLCVGSEDAVVGPEGEQKMYDYAVAHDIPAVIHIMEGAGHGFGVGQEGALKGTEECALWPGEADQFMMVNKGRSQGVAPTGVYTLENGVVDAEN